jgi:cbb3-type cytochrome oxidase maturation protein
VTLLTLALILGGLAMAAAAGFLFVAAVRSGQMDDLEDVKFQMLREDNDK